MINFTFLFGLAMGVATMGCYAAYRESKRDMEDAVSNIVELHKEMEIMNQKVNH